MSLLQTWDVIESPMFASVFSEAADTCLRGVINHLKVNVFTLSDSEEEEEEEEEEKRFKSPPLASLLPQLKGAALRLLPTDPSAAISSDVREMLSSTSLDALCVSLFDLGLSQNSTSSSSNSSNNSYGLVQSSQKSNSSDGSWREKDGRNSPYPSTNWPF